MSNYPESLLAAARAVKLLRDDGYRRSQETWSYSFGGDSRPSEIMVREDLEQRAESRRAREVEAHYEAELAAYEALLATARTGGDK